MNNMVEVSLMHNYWCVRDANFKEEKKNGVVEPWRGKRMPYANGAWGGFLIFFFCSCKTFKKYSKSQTKNNKVIFFFLQQNERLRHNFQMNGGAQPSFEETIQRVSFRLFDY